MTPNQAAVRRLWAPKIARGEVNCPRCDKTIERGTAWNLVQENGEAPKPIHADCDRRSNTSTGTTRTSAGRPERNSRNW